MQPAWVSRGAIASVFLSLTLAAGCARAPHSHAASVPSTDAAYSAEVREGIARARAATAAFANLDSAVASGYARDVAMCVADSVQGAMGYHHFNRAYIDARVEVEHPEALVYERLPDGRYRLNGLEYMIPFRFWPGDSVPPKFLGLELKHGDAPLNYWYTHLWIWTENPSGMFADWNPRVKCASNTKKS